MSDEGTRPGETGESELIRNRRKNLEAIAALGHRPYPNFFPESRSISAVVAEHGGHDGAHLEAHPDRVATAGRVRALRTAGKAGFLDLSDGSAKIQVYVRRDVVGDEGFALYGLLDFGDWIGVEGPVFRTRTNELTIWAAQLSFLAKCLLPLPEKWHGLTDSRCATASATWTSSSTRNRARVFEAPRRDRLVDPRVSSTRAATSRSRRR